MKRTLFALFLLAACGKSPEHSLVGTWKFASAQCNGVDTTGLQASLVFTATTATTVAAVPGCTLQETDRYSFDGTTVRADLTNYTGSTTPSGCSVDNPAVSVIGIANESTITFTAKGFTQTVGTDCVVNFEAAVP